MADHPPDGGPPPSQSRTGWPYEPACHDPAASAGPELAPWAQPPPAPPAEPASPSRPQARRRSWSAVLVVAVSMVLVGALSVAVVTLRRSEREIRSQLAPTTTTPPIGRGAPTTLAPAVPGADLVLLDGRVVVAARPGWRALDSTPDFASVSLALHDPTGRALVSTMSIVTLSSARSLDTTLALDGGTGFEVAGVDGPLRVTAQPGRAARLVAGAVRPKATFFLNVSIFTRDGQPLELAALQAIVTDQLAPTLRFP